MRLFAIPAMLLLGTVAAASLPTVHPVTHAPKPDVLLTQSPPSPAQIAGYKGLHSAVHAGDLGQISTLVIAGADLEARDPAGRTPLMIAGFQKNHAAARLLIKSGADLNATENSVYDLLTIASVLNDVEMVKLAIEAGANTGLVTSPYEGTALIAAAHLGHVEVVKALIAGKAPLDHVNNLQWTALIEAIVLGDGGPNHVEVLRALVQAGADVNLADGNGTSPLTLAIRRGFSEMIEILKAAGARP